MPPAKLNRSVIIFDLKMDRAKAMSILEQIIMHKIVDYPKDTMQLILLHSEKTDNISDYPHISTVIPKDVQFNLEMRSHITGSKTEEGDWLLGLKLAVDILSDKLDQKNIMTHQLIFITDFDAQMEYEYRRDDIEYIINKLCETHIHLYVFGPEIIPGKTICSKDDISDAILNMSFIDKSYKKNPSCRVGVEIVEEGGGIICGPDMVLDFLTLFAERIPKQPWNEPLTFQGFKFPTSCSKIVVPDTYLKVHKERPQVKFCLKDDVTSEVHYEDVVNMYCYLDKPIAFPKDVIDSFKYLGERMFKLIGFVKSEDIPELYMGFKDVYKVELIDEEHAKAEAFYALISECRNANKYALALKCHNKNNAPILFVLIPQPPARFLMVPHAELVVGAGEMEDGTPIKSPMNEKLYTVIDKYLKQLSQTHLGLHPYATVTAQKKQYYKNVVDTLDNREATILPKEEVKSEVWTDLLLEFGVKKEEEKFVEDDDEDW